MFLGSLIFRRADDSLQLVYFVQEGNTVLGVYPSTDGEPSRWSVHSSPVQDCQLQRSAVVWASCPTLITNPKVVAAQVSGLALDNSEPARHKNGLYVLL